MLGFVTADDMLDIAESEATEDIQKLGGSEALDAPYIQAGLWSMIRKRGGRLSAPFLGEMLAATAMSFFAGEIARAVVLALFVPLIISSGGNSGSEAASLVIRALALRELKLHDWFRVFRRELIAGLAWLLTWSDRLLPNRRLAASTSHELRRALRLARLHNMGEPHRSCHVWNAGGKHVAVHPSPSGIRPRRKLLSFRSRPRGRYRALHLFSRGVGHPPGHPAMNGKWKSSIASIPFSSQAICHDGSCILGRGDAYAVRADQTQHELRQTM
jgi:hypothetical protein